jgi:hypothetical protein
MVSNGRSCNEYRDEGRFDGPRVDCEQVPFLPAWAVAWALDDPRKIPYLLVWRRPEDSSAREIVRVSVYSERPSRGVNRTSCAETKRPDGTRDLLHTHSKPLPRNGGKARLLVCPRCQSPRRGPYGWELGGKYTAGVRRSPWGCRKCSLLRYASEGGSLLIRPRPESWFPSVFTWPEGAAEAGGLDTEDVAVFDNSQDVMMSIPKLQHDEANAENAPKEGDELFADVCESLRYRVMSYSCEQVTPREVPIQREIQKITSNTQKYQRYLELTAKQSNSITFTIPRGRW